MHPFIGYNIAKIFNILIFTCLKATFDISDANTERCGITTSIFVKRRHSAAVFNIVSQHAFIHA